MDYREAGVDVAAGRAFVDQIRDVVQSTHRPEVIGGLGGFSGLFQLPAGYREPVLVSGTDGVGTKLALAHSLNCHHTVGIDLVAMCVNDVLTAGAEPLFFLDYLATAQLKPDHLAQVIAGIAEGCRLSGCALLGGETAEMPGFYQPGQYDLAGFCVGIVERQKLLDGSQAQVGDVAIGLASQGVHSNGFSLIRKIIQDKGLNWHDSPPGVFNNDPHESSGQALPELSSPWGETRSESFRAPTVGHPPTTSSHQSLGEILMTPTRIYVKPVLGASQAGLEIHGMAHITGGGLPENLPRCLGPGQSVQIYPQQWSVPPIFTWIAATGEVSAAEMFNTFNMGIGFVLLVPVHHTEQTLGWFESQNIPAYQIGEVVTGDGSLTGLHQTDQKTA